MGYTEVTVIVDGAFEQSEAFADDDAEGFDAYIAQLAAEAETYDLPTEVYILHHPHADDGAECVCAQYETDHHPAYAWNMED